jgi:hypothetical protein
MTIRRAIRIPDKATFWALGAPQASGCIHWTGKVDDHGYGRMGPALTGSVYAHRSAWVLANGPIPEGMTVEHHCHSGSGCTLGDDCLHRRCINTDHMELLPQPDNAKRQHWVPTEKCPRGHDKRTLPSGQRYCPTCTSAAKKAWLGKDGNRENQNTMRAQRHRAERRPSG